jgi:hypothetical protein
MPTNRRRHRRLERRRGRGVATAYLSLKGGRILPSPPDVAILLFIGGRVRRVWIVPFDRSCLRLFEGLLWPAAMAGASDITTKAASEDRAGAPRDDGNLTTGQLPRPTSWGRCTGTDQRRRASRSHLCRSGRCLRNALRSPWLRME